MCLLVVARLHCTPRNLHEYDRQLHLEATSPLIRYVDVPIECRIRIASVPSGFVENEDLVCHFRPTHGNVV